MIWILGYSGKFKVNGRENAKFLSSLYIESYYLTLITRECVMILTQGRFW